MQKISFFFLLSIFFLGCTNNPSTTADTTKAETPSEVENKDLDKYPEALQSVFDKHGSLENWQKMKAMAYEIVEEEGNEKQYIDLKNRRERIEANTFTTGFDGEDFWLEADTNIYKGNPVFYHNLMFYFYAMPFVLADEGVIYSETEDLEFEGKSYPGIGIAYEDGVGASSKDEYFIHYDPDTFEMAWLGYTVTYYSKEISEKVKWIRYDDWNDFDGLILPNSMSWYTVEEGQLIAPRSTAEFVNVMISEESFVDDVFMKTSDAIIVE